MQIDHMVVDGITNYYCDLTWDKDADSEYVKRQKYHIRLCAVGKKFSVIVLCMQFSIVNF